MRKLLKQFDLQGTLSYGDLVTEFIVTKEVRESLLSEDDFMKIATFEFQCALKELYEKHKNKQVGGNDDARNLL